MVAFKVKET